jgi:peptidoglycan/xylan/chitin deacetylase (PgdA/CDA1 family)
MSNRRPIVSFSFDDFPRSAAANGARILENHGMRGTFYAAGSLCNKVVDGTTYYNASDLENLIKAGHEIGCHSFRHVSVTSIGRTELQNEIRENAAFFAALPHPQALLSFSYPFGQISPLRKLILQHRFVSCRGIRPGVNCGVADLGLLRATPLYTDSLTNIHAQLEKASSKNGWLVFYTHDVDENPSPFGCTPALFETAVQLTASAGFDVMTVRDAVSAIEGLPRQP